MIQPYINNRNHLVEILRFMAASWVVLFHFSAPTPQINNFYRSFCGLGYLGVPVFFIISGYCICIASQHSKTPLEFILKRLCRIFPPYWFSLLVVIICILIVKIFRGTNSLTVFPKTIPEIIATFSLYTYPLSKISTINWVYWTLTYEIIFYVLIFLVSFFNSPKIRIIFFYLLTTLAILLPVQKEGFAFFFNELPTFFLGYCLYLAAHETEDKWYYRSLMILIIIAIYNKHPTVSYLSTSGAVCCLILSNDLKPLKANVFSRMGDYSYSIYLLHVPIGIYLLGSLKDEKIIQHNVGLNIIVDLSLLTIIIWFSKLSYLKIELPSIKLGRRLATKATLRL